MPAFTPAKAPHAALATTDGTWTVALRERDSTVGIEVRETASNAVKGWARISHHPEGWRLSDFAPSTAALPKRVHAEAQRIFSAVV